MFKKISQTIHFIVNNKRKIIYLFFTVFLLISASIVAVNNLHVQNNRSQAQTPTNSLNNYDVIIVGGGSSGISAAIQAARLGASVAVFEETDWIGGQMTAAGVSTMDGNDQFRSGIYKEFTDKIINYYNSKGKSVGTCYFSNNKICFEPSVGQKILYEMIDETRKKILSDGKQPILNLFLHTKIKRVIFEGQKIKGVATQTDSNYFGKIIIEATEYGDILELSQAAYRAGNSTSASLNLSACMQDITYNAIIKRYPTGIPPDLIMNNPPPGYNEEVKQLFAKKITLDGSVDYHGVYPVNWNVHNAYRGLPNSQDSQNYNAGDPQKYYLISKTGVNWANDFPFTVADLDQNRKKQIFCEAKLRTLQFLYYVQHDLGQTNWSIANDEGYDTPYNREENSCPNIPEEFKAIEKHFPQIPYVREARRGVGLATLTAKQIYREGTPPRAKEKIPSSVAVGDYAVDLHNCKSNETLEAEYESVADVPAGFRGGPFQIPFEALLHKDVDNLILAEKNISDSRLANGATRLQPITMLIGQAAGTIAALSSRNNLLPKNLSLDIIQDSLLEAGSYLYGFTDVTVDSPYFRAIQKVTIKGYMSGYGNSYNFGPEDNLDRAQISVVLSKFKNLPIYEPQIPTFTDVSQNTWYYKWVETLNKGGLTAGCNIDPKLYCPLDWVSRDQLATFLVKAVGETPYTGTQQSFTDVSPLQWFYKWIEKAVKLKFISGFEDGTFRPELSVKRDFVAEALMKINMYLSSPTPTTTPTPISIEVKKPIPTKFIRLTLPSSRPTKMTLPTPIKIRKSRISF
ncbi:MAG: FAD-dependent oxidoreductase [Patescibacteria group bacterium]|mgnify:CR=1 FL=1